MEQERMDELEWKKDEAMSITKDKVGEDRG